MLPGAPGRLSKHYLRRATALVKAELSTWLWYSSGGMTPGGTGGDTSHLGTPRGCRGSGPLLRDMDGGRAPSCPSGACWQGPTRSQWDAQWRTRVALVLKEERAGIQLWLVDAGTSS